MQSRQRELGFLTRKLTSIEDFPLDDGRSLKIVNSHILLTVGWKEQIENVINEIKDHDGPIIWAGDFNTVHQGRVGYLFWRLTRPDIGLEPVPIRYRRRSLFHTNYLDYVFVKGLKILNGVQINYWISDHAPIAADLIIE